MELRHLRYFVAVAEELNFTHAAARLRVAQPALSRQMKDLECELQTPLFQRGRTGVQLTRAGRVFYQRARSILAQAAEAANEARSASGAMTGSLVLGFALSLIHISAMNAPSIAPSNATQCRAETALASGARLGTAALQFAVVEFKPTLLPDLDLCDGRHAGHEAAFAIAHALAVESDPDRHTLDDSGEVARGVVRRQQRELGAAGRSEALDPASKYAAGKGVHVQPHGLAWLNPGKLRLFERCV